MRINKRWVQSIIILTVIIIFLVLGYQLLKKHNLPDTPAGFHLFESGTKKYTILVPENYIMAEGSYYRKRGLGSEFPDTKNVYID